jgi:glycosyltransferase involved in cell wall biosynthesis
MTAPNVPPNTDPRLAVVIPVYQDPGGARASLQSLGCAAYPCATVIIIVDDGSDPVLELGDPPAGLDVRIVRQATNTGIETALNRGFAEAAALGVSYIARLDAGDIVASERFVLQYDILEGKPEIGIVGSSARFVDESGALVFTVCPPVTDPEIRRGMHISCCLLHPTVMLRVSALAALGPIDSAYSSRYQAAEDYDLFFRVLGESKAINLPQPLVDKVYSATGISRRRRRTQLLSRLQLQLRHFDLWSLSSPLGIMVTLGMMLTPEALVAMFKRLLGNSRW